MDVQVTLKFEEDLMISKDAILRITFLHYKSMEKLFIA